MAGNPKSKAIIVSTIRYAKRVLAMVDVENSHGKFRTYFYRSTGTNVDGKGMWFPFSCIAGPGAIERTYMHSGWISKNMVIANEKFMTKVHTMISNERDHSDPVIRLDAYRDSDLKFNVEEVSQDIYHQFETTLIEPIASFEWPVEPDDIEFINTWITKGLRVMYPDKTEKLTPKEPKPLTEREEDILRSMII